MYQLKIQALQTSALLAHLTAQEKEGKLPTDAAAQTAIDMIARDPSYVETLEKEQKPLMPKVRELWAQKYNGEPLPPILKGDEQKNQNLALRTLNNVANVRRLLADPDVAPSIGAVYGNIGLGEQKLGTALPGRLTDVQVRKAQELRASLEYLLLSEGKNVMGGRIPQQTLEGLKDVSARPNTQTPMLLGSLKATKDNAVGSLRAIYQAHGQAPPSVILPLEKIYAKNQKTGEVRAAAPGTPLPPGWIAVKGPQ